MYRSLLLSTAFFTTLVALAACASGKSGMGNVVVSACDTSVTLVRGGKLTFRQQATRSAGYNWGLASQSKPLLKQNGEPTYKDTEHEPGIDGAPEIESIEFTAETIGTGDTLEFHYRRPWEKDKPPAKICRIFVDVVEK